MTSQPRKQTTAIHILPYISGSRDNQTMKFGQLIKSNMRNVFLETSYPNMVQKLVADPFLKIKIQHISGLIVLSFIQFILIAC